MKFRALLLAAAAVMIATGSQAATYTLRIGHVLAPSDPLAIATEGMKKAIAPRATSRCRSSPTHSSATRRT
jgi:TRAP-type C4-dicarboxylate transport system substrate-binding protein